MPREAMYSLSSVQSAAPGLVDFLTFSDKANPERLVRISFWTSVLYTSEDTPK